ncbi:hypothetical protein M501DRAFT_1015594 [Patellaria atrata CBS 101060]|uniref:Uncharacterized protein n=1 Tax=Patellaria atrata CBS 101060 TaxID=1346257 RepID=A0A9P4SCZ0_9PEZI|nr:hypothetical protein M501DRAFT_1015594 [Patellaria atrata CBS 101060]
MSIIDDDSLNGNYLAPSSTWDGAPTPTQSATLFLGNNTFRVFVRLLNGRQLVIPIAVTATVAQLHEEAARRAGKFELPFSINATVLRTTGADGVLLFEEDRIVDLLDLTENHTFVLSQRDKPPVDNLPTTYCS